MPAPTKTLPVVAQELGCEVEVLVGIVRSGGVFHGKRRENLDKNLALVAMHQEEIEQIKAKLQVENRQSGRQGSKEQALRSSPASRTRSSTTTTSGVKITYRSKRREVPKAMKEPLAASPVPAETAAPAPMAVPVSKPIPPASPVAKKQDAGSLPAADQPAVAELKEAAEPAAAESKPAFEQPPAPVPGQKPAVKGDEQRSPPPKKAARGKKARNGSGEQTDEERIGRKRKSKETLTVTDKAKDAIRQKKRRKQRMIDHLPKVHGFQRPAGRVVRAVEIPETISLQVLAQRMAVKAADIVSELFKAGMTVTINSVLDQETAAFVAHEMGHNPVLANEPDFKLELELGEDVELAPRAPVVTVMGHVDHGKTSLLDRIRKTRVADDEAGGITQHMGAYRVDTTKGTILFIDTPGHELFTEMRARGAKVTDIIVLVVAADDGVMPQTEEAINHAKAAEVPIVVAINKIDKSGADPENVIKQLLAKGVAPENWGGDNIVINVSAATGEGIAELLDAIVLQADLLELTAPVNVPARGIVIEARTDKGKGHLVTMIAKGGELREGDIIICGTEFGRVRTLFDSDGKRIETATPSVPFVAQGLSGLPSVGSEFHVLDSEKRAREIAEVQRNRARDKKMAALTPTAFPDLSAIMANGASVGKVTLNVIVKADVFGTLEALTQALKKETNDEAEIRIVHSGIGGITTSDVNLAHASAARIVAFNVRPDGKARSLIESRSVPIGYYSVIYEATKDLHKTLTDMLAPIMKEQFLGACRVLEVFRISRVGKIAGCRVEEGLVTSASRIRVVREGANVYEGEISTLKHFKDEVREVKSGLECGIQLKRFQDFKAGDVLEAFEIVELPRESLAASEKTSAAQPQLQPQ